MLSALNEAAIKLLSKKKPKQVPNESQINIFSPVLSSDHIMNSLLAVLWKNFTYWCNIKGAVQPKIEFQSLSPHLFTHMWIYWELSFWKTLSPLPDVFWLASVSWQHRWHHHLLLWRALDRSCLKEKYLCTRGWGLRSVHESNLPLQNQKDFTHRVATLRQQRMQHKPNQANQETSINISHNLNNNYNK